MSRSKNRIDADSDDEDAQLEQKVGQLTDAVRELAGQVEVLRNAMDEFTSQFTWAIRNDKLAYRPDEWMVRLRSMPADAAAPDWAERVQIESIKIERDCPTESFRDCGHIVAKDGQPESSEESQSNVCDETNHRATEPNGDKQACLW